MVNNHLNSKSSLILTRLTFIFLLMWAVWVPKTGYAQQCNAPLSDSSIEHLTKELCGKTFAMIDLVNRALNLGGGNRDEDLERMIAILNTFDGQSEPNANDTDILIRDAARILVERPGLRRSLKKNLVVSLFEDDKIQQWCRWIKRDKFKKSPVTNQKTVDSIDEIIRCGIE